MDVARRSVRHCQVLVIGVQAGFDLHRVDGRLRERIDTACVPTTSEREARVRDDRRNYDWSDEESNLTTEHVSPSAIEELRRLLLAAGDGRACDGRSSRRPISCASAVFSMIEDSLTAPEPPLCCPDRGETPSMSLQYLRRRTPGGPLAYPATDLSAPVCSDVAQRRSAAARDHPTSSSSRGGRQRRGSPRLSAS